MSITSAVLAGLLAMVFVVLGTAKALAVAPMRALAAHIGFSPGALMTHLRNGDGVRRYTPAVLCAALVVAYLVALYGASR